MPKIQAQSSTDASVLDPKTSTFEAALKELESIVLQLESGDLQLETSLGLHERGPYLVALCNTYLGQVDLRLKQLGPESQ